MQQDVQLTKTLGTAIGECIGFSDLCLEKLGKHLTSYQLAYRWLLIESVLSGQALELPVQWARQSGKTETHIHVTMALAAYMTRWLCRHFPIAYIAPSREEQAVVVMRERLRENVEPLRSWLKVIFGIDFALDKGRRTNDYIFKSSTGFEAPIHCVSASPRAFTKGQTFPLMFLEQVEDIDEYVMKNSIFPFGAGSETGCLLVLAGSAAPRITNNYFYNAIHQQLQDKGARPPYFVNDVLAAQERPGYGEYIELMKAKLGEESDAYKTQFGNIWAQPVNKPFDRTVLLSLKWALATDDLSKLQKPIKIFSESFDDIFKAVGADIAKDVDSTVLTGGFRFGEHSFIERWIELHGTDYEDQADTALDFIQRGKYETGPGNPFIDMLRRRILKENAKLPEKQRIKCFIDGQPMSAESNNRIYSQYIREVTHRRLFYPATESREQQRFLQQHYDVLRSYGAKSMMTLRAPSGQHDDFVSSGALFLDALIAGRRGPRVMNIKW